MSKPVILIDFDGVFNILDRNAESRRYWNRMLSATIPYDDHVNDIKQFTVQVGLPLIDFLKRLASSGVVDIYWLTTWVKNTEKFPSWLGMPVLPWLARPEVEDEWGWWKLDVVKQFVPTLEADTPVLWIDDDHGFDGAAVNWLLTAQTQVQSLAPESGTALMPLDVDLISLFVEKHTGVQIALDVSSGL